MIFLSEKLFPTISPFELVKLPIRFPDLRLAARGAIERRAQWWRDEMIGIRALGVLQVFVEESRFFWLFIGGLAAAWLFSDPFSNRLEDQLRYVGGWLELFGVVTVAIGLVETRRLFDGPSMIKRAMGLFERLRGAAKKPVAATVQLTDGSEIISGAGIVVTKGLGPDATIEERLAALEKSCKKFEDELQETRRTLNTSILEAKKSISQESTERQRQTLDLRRLLIESSVGGIRLETVGLWWLIVGILLPFIPEWLSFISA